MSKRKNTIKDKARELKKQGLLDIDLRFKLTKNQQRTVKRRFEKYGHYLGESFTARNVSAKRAKQLRAMGYQTHKRADHKKIRVWLPREGLTDRQIKIKGDEIVYRAADHEQRVQLFEKRADIYKRLQREEKKPRGYHELVTVRIGDNNAFAKKFHSVADLMKYLKTWSPANRKRGDKWKKSDLIKQMAIVRLYGADTEN